MTVKFEGFVSALKGLCVEHKVLISATMYDGLQVWDFGSVFPPDPLCFPSIEDCTKGGSK